MTDIQTEVFPVGTSTPVPINRGPAISVLHILKNVGDTRVYLQSDASDALSFNFEHAMTLDPGEILYDLPNAVNDVDTHFLYALSSGRDSRLVAIY